MSKLPNALPGTFFLAPMAEITTPAFRKIVKQFSEDIVMFSEMLSAGAVVSRAAYNQPLIKIYELDAPFIYQLLGDSPEKMARAAQMLCENNCYGIDINMGCSAPEILKKNQGARLLTDFKLTEKIIKECRKVITKNFSVKIRTGYTEQDTKTILEYVKMFNNEGIDFITVHPRYAKQSFKGKADWSIIQLITENSTVPVIGNGDIKDPVDGINKLNKTGCGGIMIGRESIKSPWIFKILSSLYKKNDINFNFNIHKIFIDVLQNIQSMLPLNLHRSRSHRFASYFVKNVTFSHVLFTKLRNTETIETMIEIVDDYFNRNKHEEEINISIPAK